MNTPDIITAITDIRDGFNRLIAVLASENQLGDMPTDEAAIIRTLLVASAPVTQSDLANHVNTSERTVARRLASLRRKGLCESTRDGEVITKSGRARFF
jgi:predicted ArsR family transcriptional regulator